MPRLPIFTPGIWPVCGDCAADHAGPAGTGDHDPVGGELCGVGAAHFGRDRIHRERDAGLGQHRPSVGLVSVVQKHCGQTNMLLSGNDKARADLDATRAAMPATLTAASEALSVNPPFQLDSEWSALQVRLQQLPATEKQPSAQSFELHTALIGDIKRLMYTVGERSNLLFDPDPASYFLMDIAVSRAVPWSERITQEPLAKLPN